MSFLISQMFSNKRKTPNASSFVFDISESNFGRKITRQIRMYYRGTKNGLMFSGGNLPSIFAITPVDVILQQQKFDQPTEEELSSWLKYISPLFKSNLN